MSDIDVKTDTRYERNNTKRVVYEIENVNDSSPMEVFINNTTLK